MGHHRQAVLEPSRCEDGAGFDIELWHNGDGLNGLYVRVGELDFFIPRKVLETIMIEEYRSKQIGRYEGADDDELLIEMGLKRS